MLQMATELEKPTWGAFILMKTQREEQRGRPFFKYEAKALPTSGGSGRRSSRELLPRIKTVPALQSISSKDK